MTYEDIKSIEEFEAKFIESQETLEYEFKKALWNNYWDLIDGSQ